MNKVERLTPDPQTIFAYEHPALVDRLQEKLGLSQEQAEELFTDTKRFLFICGTKDGAFGPPEMIDECWHAFILFTKEYADFCNRFFR
jgi:hypothetical protein